VLNDIVRVVDGRQPGTDPNLHGTPTSPRSVACCSLRHRLPLPPPLRLRCHPTVSCSTTSKPDMDDPTAG
jgi:hypothetical protein